MGRHDDEGRQIGFHRHLRDRKSAQKNRSSCAKKEMKCCALNSPPHRTKEHKAKKSSNVRYIEILVRYKYLPA